MHTGVDCRTDGPAKGVPYLVIVPLYKGLPSVVVEILCRAEVKVRIKFMDNVPIIFDRAICKAKVKSLNVMRFTATKKLEPLCDKTYCKRIVYARARIVTD